MLTEKTIDEFAQRAADIAMQSFVRYCQAHALDVTDYHRAIAALREKVSAAVPQALADAKEALECGLGAVAPQTFATSMSLAGIEAAKEYASQ